MRHGHFIKILRTNKGAVTPRNINKIKLLSSEMINPKQIYWFPMRVTYGRELLIKEHLDKDNIECFLPMRYEIVEQGEERKRQLVPAVSNLIFIRSNVDTLNDMKNFNANYEPLRYIMRNSCYDSCHEIMTIADSAMENFIKLTKIPHDKVIYLTPGEYLTKHVGKHVTIVDGPFAGVNGIIKRIKRNKRVVVQLDGIIAAAIDFVPNDFLIETI